MNQCEHSRVEDHKCLDCGAVFVFCASCSVFNGQDCYHLPAACRDEDIMQEAIELTRSILRK